MTRIIEFVGDMPQNPHIFEGDSWAYYLGEIVELPPLEEDTSPRWQAEVLEIVPLSEYYERERERIESDRALTEARCNVNAYELFLYSGGA